MVAAILTHLLVLPGSPIPAIVLTRSMHWFLLGRLGEAFQLNDHGTL